MSLRGPEYRPAVDDVERKSGPTGELAGPLIISLRPRRARNKRREATNACS